MDRLTSGRDHEIKCTPLTSEIDESTDPKHQQTDRKRGLLRWEVDVADQSVGMDERNFTYKSRLEFDEGMTVSGLPALASV